MNISYTDHAAKRLKQRGVTTPEIEHVLNYPEKLEKSFDGTELAVGYVNNRRIDIKFVRRENYIRIITVM